MSRRRFSIPLLLTLAVALVLSGACSNKGAKKEQDTTPETPSRQEAVTPSEAEQPVEKDVSIEPFQGEVVDRGEIGEVSLTVGQLNRAGVLKTVFFGFDSSELDETARVGLQNNATWLNNHVEHRIVVEGHTDERGTLEYNLALGERRAAAVREYLASLGVDATRVRIVTYGEERPVDPGHDEAAWAKNRRAEFVIEE